MVEIKTKRNEDLDRELPIDKYIGELLSDERGNYRIIHGRKIYQLEVKTPRDKDLSLVINREVAQYWLDINNSLT